MDFVYLVRILLRRIWVILTIPIIAGVATFLFTQNLEKSYKAKAQLATGFTTSSKIQLTKENFDYWESKSNFDNLVEIMKSDLMGSMLTYKLLLHDLDDPNPFRKFEEGTIEPNGDSIRQKLRANMAAFTLLSSYDPFENSIIELLTKKKYLPNEWIKEGYLVIERIKDTDFIRVEFSSENPFLSAFVVNTLCEEYVRYNRNMRNVITEESLEFFASEVEKKKSDLEVKTGDLNEFKASSQVFNYNRESDSKLSQLTDYEIKLQSEESKIRGLEISLKSVEDKIRSLTENSQGSKNSKFLELRNKIAELNKIYVDTGSKDKDLETKITSLREQLHAEMAKADGGGTKTLAELVDEKDNIALDLAIAHSTAASIRERVNSLKGNVSSIGSKESTIASLERERENAFRDYTSAVERFNDAKSKSLAVSNDVKLMIRGQPNPKPESSKRIAIIAISFFGSLFLCIGAILMTEYFDYRLKTPIRFTRFVKLALLGYLNQLSTDRTGNSRQPEQESEGKNKSMSKSRSKGVEVMMHLLRKIRFIISNSDKEVILITSPNVGDGKSFFIRSLAQSLSLLNKKVLIIDTNFRNNSLTEFIIGQRMMHAPAKLKLLNDAYVKEPIPENGYPKSIIFPTSDKNVDIIGSRKGVESPSEMFAGRDFKILIENLKANYDYILMEGPSLNEYSDAKELTAFADGVIAVFSAKTSLKQKDKESIGYLRALNGKFIGGVLNFVREEDVKL